MEACGKEVVGKLASSGKALDSLTNFEMDPAIALFVGEVVFLENSSEISARQTRAYS